MSRNFRKSNFDVTRRRALSLGVTAVVAPLCNRAVASNTTPVRLIVPFSPGTGIDTVARALEPRLAERLGRPFVVDNVAGASGNIGTAQAARAKPDGNTLLVTVNTFVMNTSLYRQVPYDPVKDFEPISQTSLGKLLLVANPTAPSTTLDAFLAEAKSRPGLVQYASPGVGTPHHLAMALLEWQAGITLQHIPYKSTAGAVTDVLGGHVLYMFLPVHVALPHLRSKRLVALAVGSANRLSQLPDLPTFAERGLEKVIVDMWYGVLAPKGVPTEIVTRLNRDINEILEMPAVREAFAAQGMLPAGSTPDAFARTVRDDMQRWAEVIRRAKVSAD
ncbi:MAG: tripartite tricarboxylate transporter substrate binding protein [Gemmatimonadaceae bacterium]|nr:tripartite tricarboxylate transporter substrate binding protein [Gemmatimonadaceae bacterium]